MDFGHDSNYRLIVLAKHVRFDPYYEDDTLKEIYVVRGRYFVPFALRRCIARPLGDFCDNERHPAGIYYTFNLMNGPILTVHRDGLLFDPTQEMSGRFSFLGGEEEFGKLFENFDENMKRRIKRGQGLFLSRRAFEYRLRKFEEITQKKNSQSRSIAKSERLEHGKFSRKK